MRFSVFDQCKCSKMYTYPPMVVIRSELEMLRGLKIVELKEVKDPAEHPGVVWWICVIEFRRLQMAWNESSVIYQDTKQS